MRKIILPVLMFLLIPLLAWSDLRVGGVDQTDITSVKLGTFTGSTIPDESTVPGALQSLETAIETKEPTQTAASQVEAEAGTEAGIRSWSPLRIFQAIASWWNTVGRPAPGAIGDTTPSSGTFSPTISKGPAIVSSFAGTVSSSGTTVTFTSTEDAAQAGYSATNAASGLGATLIAAGQTRYIIAWLSSMQCTVSSAPSPAWGAGTAITSVQLPSSAEVTNDGTLKRWMDGNGDEHFAGSVGVGTTHPIIIDNSGISIDLGLGNMDAPFKIGPNVSNSSDAQVLVARNVDGTVSGNGHCFSDSSIISRGGGISYNSFDGRVVFSGSGDFGHYAAMQSGPTYSSSGTIDYIYNFTSSPTVTNGTVTNNIGFYVNNPSVTGGSITNNYGMYISALTSGATLNYAIYNAGEAPIYSGGRYIGKAVVISQTNAIASGTKPLEVQSVTGAEAALRLYQDGMNSWDMAIVASSVDLSFSSAAGLAAIIHATDKTLTLSGLAGTGTRTVGADANGKLVIIP